MKLIMILQRRYWVRLSETDNDITEKIHGEKEKIQGETQRN